MRRPSVVGKLVIQGTWIFWRVNCPKCSSENLIKIGPVEIPDENLVYYIVDPLSVAKNNHCAKCESNFDILLGPDDKLISRKSKKNPFSFLGYV